MSALRSHTHTLAHTDAAWPGAIWFAVKQIALTFRRGGEGEVCLIVGSPRLCRGRPLLRKALQGDVLFSF